MKTLELHRHDPYLTNFEAEVVRHDGDELVLNRTAFYARSGGQAGDRGTVAGFRVIETRYGTDEVVHLLDGTDVSPLDPGATVEGAIDWDHRHGCMRSHSAQHLLYLAVNQLYRLERDLGGDISPGKCRVDIAHRREFDPEPILEEIQGWIDDLIATDEPIRRGQDSDTDLTRWWWRIDDLPTIACGGTHVRSTGEIGRQVVGLKRKGSKGIRVSAVQDLAVTE